MKRKRILAVYGRFVGFHGRRLPLYILSVLVGGAALWGICLTQGRMLNTVVRIAEGTAGADAAAGMLRLAAAFVLLALLMGAAPVGTAWVESRTAGVLRARMLETHCRTTETAARRISESDLFTRLGDDLDRSVEAVGSEVNAIYLNPIVSGALSLLTMSGINWRLGMFSAVLSVVVCLPLEAMRRRTSALQAEMRADQAAVAGQYADMLGGAEEIRVFSLFSWIERRLRRRTEALETRHRRYAALDHLRLEWFSLGYYIHMIGLIAIGGLLAGKGVLPFSTVFITLPLSGQVMQMVQGFGRLWAYISERTPAMERVLEVLDAPAEAEHGDGTVPAAGADIRFDQVTFGYTEEKRVLEDISFFIPQGSSVAFVGESGCGKSTVLRLLMGLYPARSGSITVGGQTAGQVGLDAWRRKIAYIGQTDGLFDMTVGENIALGHGGVLPPEKLARAAEMAAVDFAGAADRGWDTPVGEGGRLLSGGQRQRIAAARGFAMEQASVLLMDEPTAALDAAAEEKIRQTVCSLHGRQTVVMVSHRLRFSAGCDRIYVLDDGRIAEEGTHDQLLARKGIYARLWAGQNGDGQMPTDGV